MNPRNKKKFEAWDRSLVRKVRKTITADKGIGGVTGTPVYHRIASETVSAEWIAYELGRLYHAPFTYDDMGTYVFDRDNNMVADFLEEGDTLRVRGWGRLVHVTDRPQTVMDGLEDILMCVYQDGMTGEMFATALTEHWERVYGR